jgi:hypothetical protein
MFRFERKGTVKSAADIPAAVKFATDVTSYLNKHHSLNMKFGVEMFGKARIHWYYEVESLDKAVQLNAALLQDREYAEMLNKAHGLWVEGGIKDTLVSLVG